MRQRWGQIHKFKSPFLQRPLRLPGAGLQGLWWRQPLEMKTCTGRTKKTKIISRFIDNTSAMSDMACCAIKADQFAILDFVGAVEDDLSKSYELI